MQLAYHLWPKQLEPQQSSGTPREKITLLHGMGGTGALWRPIAATLEDRFDFFAPDQRGHGGSRVPLGSDMSVLAYGADVIETCKSISFAPSWVVGHSMGVRTAVAAAHLQPHLFRGLILVDLGVTGPAGGGLGTSLTHFLQHLPTRFESRQEARKFMQDHCPDPAIGQYLIAVSQPALDPSHPAAIQFPFDPLSLVQTAEAAKEHALLPWLQELAQTGMPLLLLRGAKSLVWNESDFKEAQKLFASYPHVRWVQFENAGHGLPFEERSLFCQTLENWINSLRPKPMD